ncbi:MAG TPA: transketolase, partial [Rheinheimera sp.]|nr:transketolase [Rheinheimera sp.]
SLLYLTGYDLSIEDLKKFRQLGSKTPGHPELDISIGVETTTGPLGQGIANAVGMALAEKMLSSRFNKDEDLKPIDHFTYTFLGDGCLMEGISHETCSLADTLGLGKLIAFWDDNGISIDGHVEGWFTDNTPARFEAYGWHVISNVDGHDSAAVEAAITQAKAETSKPTLICCRTVIGYGSPNKGGSHDCHGAPLGDAEIAAARDFLQWPHAPFEIPADIYADWDAKAKGAAEQQSWQQLFARYSAAHPELAAEFSRRVAGQLPTDWAQQSKAYIEKLQANPATIASRKASQNALNAFGPLLPEFMGGSADLAGSNLTIWSGSKPLTGEDASGNYIYYGVREFGMSAIMNGIALHGGFVPYGATFLMFMEYARNAVRMAALMKQRVIFVYTHDSIGLGEDGPTHQPVEQLAALRATPNLVNWRPCDQVESAVAWQSAIERTDGPSTLIFTRQNLVQQERSAQQLADVRRGGYILCDCKGTPELIIIATGSEVELAVQAAKTLTEQGKAVRVVSMPSTDAFEMQDATYREAVLPAAVTKRIAVEAGITDSWYKYVGLNGKVIGMTGFGESAPAEQLFEYFGITTEKVLEAAQQLLA